MNEVSVESVAAAVTLGLLLGYIIFRVLYFLLPRKLKAEHLEQKSIVLTKAQQRKSKILRDTLSRTDLKIQLEKDEVATELEDKKQEISLREEELKHLQASLQSGESRLQKFEAENAQHQEKVDNLTTKLEAQSEKSNEMKESLIKRLEIISGSDVNQLKESLQEDYVNQRSLDCQKRQKAFTEDLTTHSRKNADRMLSRLLNRYSPDFTWPKVVSHVDLPNPNIRDILLGDGNSLLEELTELSEGVDICLGQEENDDPLHAIRLRGGYGIYKEASRLTLEEILKKNPKNWNNCAHIYQKHRQALEKQALKLGQEAVKTLQLSNIHPEIQAMIGALNWRTSYRQNQYQHSLEVSRLAGILAHEMGIDPDVAKRCGLLHDIGKGIDYRIEGSHAVISGDYADRFGEAQLVCDTVMSHHNDLVLETPLSYILKTADTLSGARPGARVNLEEGYQIRLSSIDSAIRSFPGILKVAIMSGGREVHVEVNHKKVKEEDLEELTKQMAKKIEEEVAYPGQIKVLVTRRFEIIAVA